MRKLGPDEAELWAKVTATIRPLSREPKEATLAVAEAQSPTIAPKKRSVDRPQSKLTPQAPSRPGTTLDGSWDRKLGKGAVTPDRVLDLHGHSLDAAWHAIDLAIERAIGAGERVILLVTGHRRSGAPPVERGKIRAAVQDWLAVSRHARRIAAVRAAHRRHGGGGSLYIVLRRA